MKAFRGQQVDQQLLLQMAISQHGSGLAELECNPSETRAWIHKDSLIGIGIPIINLGGLSDRLRLIMGILVPGSLDKWC